MEYYTKEHPSIQVLYYLHTTLCFNLVYHSFQFLSLDDIKEHKHINMKYDGIEGHVMVSACMQ